MAKTARDIMSTDTTCVGEDDSVLDAAKVGDLVEAPSSASRSSRPVAPGRDPPPESGRADFRACARSSPRSKCPTTIRKHCNASSLRRSSAAWPPAGNCSGP